VPQFPDPTQVELGRRCLDHLVRVVAIDSQSDEDSPSVPSTPGQQVLSDDVARFYADLGAKVEQDDVANVIAEFPGRGRGADATSIALMVHLDTARGTAATSVLHTTPAWSGEAVPYARNGALSVDLETYPALAPFLGHDLVHGDGRAPFGLDDKLGLAQCMTLAWLLCHHPPADHAPVVFVGRPDEEVGAVEALHSVIAALRARSVDRGFTVDGIQPLEVNIENFHAAGAEVTSGWTGRSRTPTKCVHLGGVNTHGATAAAEGYRSALRFATELRSRGVGVVGFESDELRDCDGLVALQGESADLEAALDAVVGPHRSRGASWAWVDAAPPRCDVALDAALDFVASLLEAEPGFVVRAEDSAGRLGYSNPFRMRSEAEGLVVDVRVRDFGLDGLSARHSHLEDLAGAAGLPLVWSEQYGNMGTRLAEFPELPAWASAAGLGIGTVRLLPIRGGTGIDPFLDAGIPLANLGTGYFAPESEKELTSIQMMGAHVQWLYRLVQVVAMEG